MRFVAVAMGLEAEPGRREGTGGAGVNAVGIVGVDAADLEPCGLDERSVISVVDSLREYVSLVGG